MNQLPNYRLWPWLIIGLLALLVLGTTHWPTTPAAVGAETALAETALAETALAETALAETALAAADLSATSSTEFVMASNTLSPICRFGVNVTADIDNFNITPLRMGWYLDYSARANPSQPNGVDYMPTIRLAQVRVAGQRTDAYTYTPSGTTLQNAIAGNPGAAWIIGNEPDRIDVQDDMEPHVYAAAYHELYHLIKTADPSARIVAGSIVQPTPIRLLYLDLVLQAYLDQFGRPMPVDAWSIHNFILREVSCDYNHPDGEGCWGAEIPPGVNVDFGEIVTIEDNDNMTLFAERIVRFRQWMKNRGYGHLPLYLTEYGILMPEDFGFPPARVNAFMNNTYNYLRSAQDPVLGYPADNYRLVQKWSWFSIHHLDFNGDLFFNEPPYNLTPIGQNFANYTAPIATAVDLYPWQLATTAAPFISGGSPVTLTLQTTIANSGNLTEPTGPALVRFYNGDPQNGGTQIGSDQFVTVAGCGRTAVATITWPDVSPGVYTVYVWVDPNNEIAETNANNNLQQFTILVADPSLFLPLIARPGPGT